MREAGPYKVYGGAECPNCWDTTEVQVILVEDEMGMVVQKRYSCLNCGAIWWDPATPQEAL